MQTRFRFLTKAAAFCVAAFLTLNVMGGPSPGELLREAYISLERADHDYKGQRKEAMEQVEAAAKTVGVKVRGDGKGHEKQGVSDEQLRNAERLIREAKPGLSGKGLKHANKALEHLTKALKIK